MRAKLIARIVFTLCVLQLALMLLSWLVTAAMPELRISAYGGGQLALRSLFSSEGVRWFFARFTDNIASPLLVWLLLVALAYGAMNGSGLGRLLWRSVSRVRADEPMPYRQRFALRLVLLEFVVIVVVCALLTLAPHAVLLSATGNLFPSSFSQSIVPVVAFSAVVMGLSFGMVSGAQKTFSDLVGILSDGVADFSPLFVVYLVGVQLYSSIRYVFIIN